MYFEIMKTPYSLGNKKHPLWLQRMLGAISPVSAYKPHWRLLGLHGSILRFFPDSRNQLKQFRFVEEVGYQPSYMLQLVPSLHLWHFRSVSSHEQKVPSAGSSLSMGTLCRAAERLWPASDTCIYWVAISAQSRRLLGCSVPSNRSATPLPPGNPDTHHIIMSEVLSSSQLPQTDFFLENRGPLRTVEKDRNVFSLFANFNC